MEECIMINGVGVPCVIGSGGIAEILELPLNNSEKHKLLYSASVMHSTLYNLKINPTV